MLVIGSLAMGIVAPQIARPGRDYDFVGTMDEVQTWITAHRPSQAYPVAGGKKYVALGFNCPVEFEIAWPGSTALSLLRRCTGMSTTTLLGDVVTVPTLDILYELKLSHRYLKNSPHFRKTMTDIQAMRAAGAKVCDSEWLKAREKETYTYAHPKLNVTKADFFVADSIKYIYDHDTIHLAMRHLEQPAYAYFKDPAKEVLCSRVLFDAASERVRLLSVLEESYVLAIERSQVPHPGKLSPRKSFEIALMKVCTSITSGWWREYAWEHYDAVMDLYDDTYMAKFWSAVAAGIVQPHRSAP